MSNIPISGFVCGKLSTGRDYAYGTIQNANGDNVTYLNVHAYPGTTAEAKANRQTEYGEILQVLDGQSCIIQGDLNATEISELDIFVDAGCNLANGGDFGTFITGTTPTFLFPFDNIITSADIKILSAGVADSSGSSDHKLLWADIMI
jgi:endonuclease/exonuclease/phosphatase (EEP) superfamily protein YafD